MTFSLDDCLEHIAEELEDALGGKAITTGRRGLVLQYESRDLMFRLIGSRIMSIRVSLKSGESENEEWD